MRRRQDKTIKNIESFVLMYDPLLEAVSELYVASDPMPEDQGCIHTAIEGGRRRTGRPSRRSLGSVDSDSDLIRQIEAHHNLSRRY